MLTYQLYSSRAHGSLAETLALVATHGFAGVEGYGPLLDDPAATRDALDAAGLAMPSAHVPHERLADPAWVIATSRTLGLTHVFAPFLAPDDRPADAEGWRAFGAGLDRAAAPLRDAGLTVGWHNHAFELEPLADGGTPLDHMLDGTALALELDVAWVARAGADPSEAIARHGDRIAAVHVKDLAPEGTTAEDGWADPGHGTMDWPALARALQVHAPALWVAEHDAPEDDARFAARAADTMRALGMGA